MSALGIPPPDGMPKDQQAAWYWGQIEHAVLLEALHVPVEKYIDDLISGAIEAGVIGHSIPVVGFSQPQPLHFLVAPYRTTPGGAAEREEALRRAVLDRAVPRRFRGGDPA